MKLIEDLRKNAGIHLKKQQGAYGIEVEAEFKDYVRDATQHGTDNFRVEGDGSLKHNGFEFISRGGFDHIESMDNIRELFDLQDFNDNYYVSGRTSTHIHCNMQNHTREEILRILLLYYLVEPVVVRFGGLQREGNLFCLRLCDAEDGLAPVQKFVDREYNAIKYDGDNHKYAALNVCNLVRLGTIEFRCFQGTRNPEHVNEWLLVCGSIIEEALKFNSMDEIWRKWTYDRKRLLSDIFSDSQILYQKILESCGKDFEELLDMNHSLAYSIILWDRTKDKRQAQRKPEQAYLFPVNEQELDIEQQF